MFCQCVSSAEIGWKGIEVGQHVECGAGDSQRPTAYASQGVIGVIRGAGIRGVIRGGILVVERFNSFSMLYTSLSRFMALEL